MKKQKPTRHACSQCQREFDTKKGLSNHLRWHVRQKEKRALQKKKSADKHRSARNQRRREQYKAKKLKQIEEEKEKQKTQTEKAEADKKEKETQEAAQQQAHERRLLSDGLYRKRYYEEQRRKRLTEFERNRENAVKEREERREKHKKKYKRVMTWEMIRNKENSKIWRMYWYPMEFGHCCYKQTTAQFYHEHPLWVTKREDIGNAVWCEECGFLNEIDWYSDDKRRKWKCLSCRHRVHATAVVQKVGEFVPPRWFKWLKRKLDCCERSASCKGIPPTWI